MSDVVTKRGLTIRNFTRYNTEDIVALMEVIEEHNFDEELDSFSPYSPNKVVVFNQAPAALKVKGWGGQDLRRFCKIHDKRGVQAGTISLASPKHLFNLTLEQLTFDMEDEKVLPAQFVLELVSALVSLLPVDDQHQAAPRGIEDRMKIRIEDKVVNKPPANRGKERKERQVELKKLKSLEHLLQDATGSTYRVTKVAKGLADPSFLTSLEAHLAGMIHLRDLILKAQDNLRTPAPTQKEST